MTDFMDSVVIPPGGEPKTMRQYVDETPELAARVKFVDEWCKKRGITKESLSIQQIMLIRKQPGWKNPC